MPVDPARAKSLFLNAAELNDPTERAAYLDRECGSDAELRERVEALLRADAGASADVEKTTERDQTVDASSSTGSKAGTFDYTPVAARTEDYQSHPAPQMLIAGRYLLQEKIGEGGMGEVWVAKQTEPVKRKVAIKLIKPGMDSRAVLQRFEQERQALAMMDHPNIAKVLDAGMTATGQPFFVMELVNGLPLSKFCDEAKLTPRQRLELFVPICQAVQHAHQKGVVHRDLKPANILVTLVDGRPIPKVIDFGVAKATGGKLTEESLSTQFGAVVGTLEYMSPEQAGFSSEDIDTRSDIYSLGVILYELLTGLRPIDAARLRRAALTEMIRIIREEDPSKPSTRLSTDASLPSLAALRQTEPRKLMAMLRGELDWVIMKCLEKNRERRYESANGLARDIQRYLAHEAVEARPPSAGYRLRKFVCRNRGQVLAASLLLLALLAGMAGTTWGLFEARKQEGLALAAQRAEAQRAEGERLAKLDALQKERLAVAAASKEKAANEQAQRRLVQLEKANAILASIFDNLDPGEIANNGRPLQAILVEKLDTAVAQLEGESIGDPLVVATMQNRFGISLLGLGEPGKSIVLLEKALATHQTTLGTEHPDTLVILGNLAAANREAGHLEKAEALYEEAVRLKRTVLGPASIHTLASMNGLANTYSLAGKLKLALPLHEEALTLQRETLGSDHPSTLTSMNNLALAYMDAGKPDLALPLHQEVLATRRATLGPDHPSTLTSMNNLALAYTGARKPELALPLYDETLALRRKTLGPDHPSTLTSMNNLANAYLVAGKVDAALSLYESALELRRETLGPDHPRTLISMYSLAHALRTAGKLDQALPLLEETLKLQKTKLGPDHPETLRSMNSLASAHRASGNLDLAIPLFEESVRLRKRKLGDQHPDTLNSMQNLAAAYWADGRLDQSIPLFEELLQVTEAKLGRGHPETLRVVGNLGVNYRDAGRLQEAIQLLEETHQAAGKLPTLRWVEAQLLDAYEQAGETAKESNLLRVQVAETRSKAPRDNLELAGLLAQLGLVLLKQNQPAEAEQAVRECLAIRQKMEPEDWRTFNTQSILGQALLEQQKYAEAEQMLVAGYEGMKQSEKTIPVAGSTRITEAIERLVRLYETTDRPKEAARWREELAERDKAKNPLDAQSPQ